MLKSLLRPLALTAVPALALTAVVGGAVIAPSSLSDTAVAAGNTNAGTVASVPGSPVGGDSTRLKWTLKGNNTFEAYANAGEYVSAAFKIATPRTAGESLYDYTVTMTAPDRQSWSVHIPGGAPLGNVYQLLDHTSAVSGIWRIQVARDGNAGDATTSYRPLNFGIDVATSPGDVGVQHGRVWSPRPINVYGNAGQTKAQLIAGKTNIDFYYLSDEGYLYHGIHRGYNGIDSAISAYKRGLIDDQGDIYYGSLSVSNQKYRPRASDAYKIFLEDPDRSMPEEATTWRGGSYMEPLNRIDDPLVPSFSNVTYTRAAGATDHRGVLSWDVANFDGEVQVVVDTDLSGTITPDDLKVRQSSDTHTYTWNGKDADGNVVDTTKPVKMWVRADHYGEIHFIRRDVEVADGFRLQRINGPVDGRNLMHWDDSALSTDASHTTVTAEKKSAPGGEDAWTPVNGLHDLPIGTDPANKKQGWGNSRFINDWAYIDSPVQASAQDDAMISDLKVLKTVQGTPERGDIATYTVTVTNAGTGTASNVVVNDTPPAQAVAGSGTFSAPSRGSVDATDDLKWNVGTLNAGETATATVTFTVADDALGDLTNHVTVDSPDDPYSGGTQDNATIGEDDDNYDEATSVVQAADLRILKEAHGTFETGGLAHYTITVRNDGNIPATGVTVDDILPVGAVDGTVKLTNPSQGGTDSTHWTVGTLDAGATATVDVSFKIANDAANVIVNRATVDSPEDPYTGGTQDNDTLSDDTDGYDIVRTPVLKPDLKIDKTVIKPAAGHKVSMGDTVAWKITVTNDGQGTARDVEVDEHTPATIDPSSFAYGTAPTGTTVNGLDWSVGDLAAGQTKTITVSGVVDDIMGNTVNWATASGSNTPVDPDMDRASCRSNPDVADDDDQCDVDTVQVKRFADVKIVKDRIGTKPLEDGDTLTWKVTVTNAGNEPANDVIVTDKAPKHIDASTMRFGKAPVGTLDEDAMTWHIPSLKPGDTYSVRVRGVYSAPKGGNHHAGVVNEATATYPGGPKVGNHCQDNVTLADDTDGCDLNRVVPGKAHLQVNKALADGSTADNVTWVLRVRNDGKATARNVVVKDKLPAGAIDVKVDGKPSQGTFDTGNGVWRVGNLAVGDTATVKISHGLDASKDASGTKVRNRIDATADNAPYQGGTKTNSGLSDDGDQFDAATFTVPAPAADGQGDDDGPVFSALPNTGGPSLWAALGGLVAIVAGAALALRNRRRHA